MRNFLSTGTDSLAISEADAFPTSNRKISPANAASSTIRMSPIMKPYLKVLVALNWEISCGSSWYRVTRHPSGVSFGSGHTLLKKEKR